VRIARTASHGPAKCAVARYPDEMTPESPAVEPLSARARYGLAAWAILLVALFLAAGLILVQSMRANRQASAGRHAARVDPSADEPGVTAADRDLPADAKPTQVLAGIYVDRVLELSVKEVHWTVEFYLWFRWRGDTPKSCEDFQLVDGTIESKDQEADETVAGERYQRFRVVAKITKFFDVSRFPCDDHQLTIGVELPAHVRHEVQFVADRENTAVSSRVRVPAYNLGPAAVLEKPHSYKTTRGDPRLPAGTKSTYSQLRVGIGIERAGWGLYFKLFQSLYVAVLLALLAFFIRPTEVDPRFGLGVGALFAAVANAYVISSLVPDTGVLALADVVNGVGIGVILLTVVQSTISLHLYTHGREALSRTFDRLSFAVILPAYVLLNIALPLAAAPR
jgi:hypothetical protein